MNLTINRPSYNCEPIRSLGALSKALSTSKESLQELAGTASSRYRLAKPVTKPDGTIRQPFDALEPLKNIHGRIKNRILARATFPLYLTGSLKGRDYRVNAALHAGAKIVISEDIEGFFPSTSADRIHGIWREVFRFSEDVCELLTRLTIKDGYLPQGAITSGP